MRHLARSPVALLMSLALLAASLLAMAFFVEREGASQQWVRHTFQVQLKIAEVRFLLRLAESSQRGLLLTGKESYAEPFASADSELNAALKDLSALVSDNRVQLATLANLRATVSEKLAELRTTVEAVRAGKIQEALATVQTDRGLVLAGRANTLFDQMLDEEQTLLADRVAEVHLARFSIQALVLGGFLATCALGWKLFRDREIHFLELKKVNAALTDVNKRLREEGEARSRLEQQLHHSQKLDAIGQLTGGIAHDFNNALSVVINSLQVAKRLRERDDPRFPQFVEDAIEAAHRAATLTKHLLTFSRQQPLDPSVIDCNGVIGGIADLLHHTLGSAIKIETIRAAGLWRTRVDPNLLGSAILNLALNARDAMPDGGKLTIETANAYLDDDYAAAHIEVTPGQYVLLCISDTGFGMPREIIEKAFDPFFTTKGVGKGTGLGLSQVYGFVKQSRGHVKIYSEVREGTTLKLYLPRFRGQDEREGIRKQKAEDIAPFGKPGQLVLVVDDDEGVLKTTMESFRELGHQVLGAASAGEALKILADHPETGLLFTDVVMPEMNGRLLAEKARAASPGLKVIFTTGFSRNAIIHNGVLDADVEFLPKPFTIEQLARKVKGALTGGDMAPPATVSAQAKAGPG